MDPIPSQTRKPPSSLVTNSEVLNPAFHGSDSIVKGGHGAQRMITDCSDKVNLRKGATSDTKERSIRRASDKQFGSNLHTGKKPSYD